MTLNTAAASADQCVLPMLQGHEYPFFTRGKYSLRLYAYVISSLSNAM